MGNFQSNPSSSAQTTEKRYEVFLNFRGTDTRDGFTNNLYKALRAKSIEVFMDEPGLKKGDTIGPNLLQTIRDSNISVVIFSKNYASSKWCLRELAEIMECEKKKLQTVIPVFYQVSVEDVKNLNLKGSFKDGFDELKNKFDEKLEKDKAARMEHVDSANPESRLCAYQTDSCMAFFDERAREFLQEMQNWREALIKASRVKGWDSSQTRPETILVDEIVKDISEKLMSAYIQSPCDFRGLYGFEERFEKVMSLLCLHNTDIRIIGIWGMGGIGKSTLADNIFHQISDDEYGKCFIQNVRQRLEQCGGLVSVLQQEVLSQVLNDRDIKLHTPTLPQHIKERLCRKKVFIVLDDVDDFFKVENLAGGLDRLGSGSRIILTSRNKDILKRCGVIDRNIYEVPKLSNEKARQFFCEYAFKQQIQTEDLMALSDELLSAIKGNPLGLKVVGSALSILNKDQWQSALSRLKKSSEILRVLQISYDGLEDEDKDTFLDIAFFCVGKHQKYVKEIFGDCSYSLETLFDRSLITISSSNIIHMHDLLQEMGREIVRKEFPCNPGNRSRLWAQEDVLDILKNGDGTDAIRGIFLNMQGMNEEQLSSHAFEKMKNLRFLKFYDSTFHRFEECSCNLCFANDPSYLSDKLRSLYWDGYPFKALPSNFVPKNLVELNLKYSNLQKLCENTMHAPKLKRIIFETCPYLIKISDHLDAPLLEEINIQFCNNLLGFPSHVDQFNKLRKLNLSHCREFLFFPSLLKFNELRSLDLRYCENLRSFPNISFRSLVYLDLSYCINLPKISDLLDGGLLRMINLTGCKNLLGFPSPVKQFNKLRKLDLRSCENLQSFPGDVQFPSLISLDLYGCTKLNTISNVLNAPLLESIDVGNCKNLLGFPSSVNQFDKLRKLNLRYCENLQSFPADIQFPSLCELNLSYCENFQSFPGDIKFPSLISLDLYGCTKLNTISNVLDAPLLESLDVGNCENLLGFPSPPVNEFKKLQFNKLRELNLRYCKNLQSFPGDIQFPSLISLDLNGCTKLNTISNVLNAPLLESLDVGNCKNLLGFPSPPDNKFNNLRELNLRYCENLQSFPSNKIHFPSLTWLDFEGCIKFKEFPHISGKIKHLYMRKTAIQEVPLSILNLTELVLLDLKGCTELKRISTNICKLKALEELCLSGCSTLVCFPEISEKMESLKILDLSGTAIEGLHHSIENLSGLEELRLKRCQNIHEVPPSIVNLTELVDLDLKGCIGLKNFSSICEFKALRQLDLSFCSALSSFPIILKTMKNLEYLNLSGTAIKELDHSIENLSGLKILCLRGCKNLDMLTISIFNLSSLSTLDLSGCSKLEKLPGNSTTKLSIRSCSLQAYFTNCLKLNMTAIINMMGIKQHWYLTTKGCATKFVYSGSEAPRCFEPLTAGSSKNIQISGHNDVKGHLIGLALCAVIEFYDEGHDDGVHDDGGHDDEGHDDESNDEESDDDEGYGYYGAIINYEYSCACKGGGGRFWWNYFSLRCRKSRDETLIDPKQIVLWYDNASKFELCSECTNCEFQFYFKEKQGSRNCKVTYCGVCPVYEEHSKTLLRIADQTCAAADQDFGGTSIKE